MMNDASYFFCGIGGSGMLPLAMIVQSRGHVIQGSDRSRDQGRTPEKFDWLTHRGIGLFAQDGSGVTSPNQIVVASGAIENTVPDIAAARKAGATLMTRPELLSQLFNASPSRIGVAGTSGKSTITGMIAWILHQAGLEPTVMNGAVMKNFTRPDHPFASALIGAETLFVAEVDESDGSISRYDPTVAIVSNISLDHKSMQELTDLFGGFASRAGIAVLNLDNAGTASLAATMIRQNEEAGTDYGVVTFSVEGGEADFRAETLQPLPAGMSFSVSEHGKPGLEVVLNVPGAHNVANALAALAAVRAVGVALPDAIAALQTFTGIRRRLEVVGTRSGITVIDDFAHNPDKIAATLRTLHAFEGRLLILFQPHGFGPLRLMKSEFIEGFASLMNDEDILLLPEPVYYGGTTDRSVGSLDIAQGIRSRGRKAEALPTRTACGERLVELARPGDRILIMGARDDTLSEFAQALLDQLEH